MEVKPSYKQTEVGAERGDWRDCDISDLCGLQRGFDITEATRKAGDVPVYSSSGLSYFHNEAKLKPPAVITGRKGILGKVFFVEEPCWPHDTTLWIKDFKGNDPSFVYRFLIQFRLERFDAATAVPTLNRNNLLGIPIKLPPLLEQRAIAGALSDVDALIGALDRLIAKKCDLKQAVMQQLLTGQKRLPGFHGEWEVKRLGDVTTLIPGGIYGEEKPRDALMPCCVATTAHIDMDDTWNSKEMNVRYFSREQVERYSPIEGDLIIVKSSGSAAKIQSGKIGFVDRETVGRFLFSNFLMLLRPTAVAPRFLYFYLCSHNVKKLLPTLVEASTYPNIRIGEYLSLEIPIPPLLEQTAIAEVLSDMDAELEALTQRRDKTRALKQGMMQELLTGRTRLV